jgi:hypothetical protein
MNEVSMSASDIIEHIRKGAKLYRGFGDNIELRMPDGGLVYVPQLIFDGLVDESRIVSESGVATGFYRLA